MKITHVLINIYIYIYTRTPEGRLLGLTPFSLVPISSQDDNPKVRYVKVCVNISYFSKISLYAQASLTVLISISTKRMIIMSQLSLLRILFLIVSIL